MPLFRGKKAWAILSGILLSSMILAACGENSPTILNTKGPVAGQEATLFWFTLIVATGVFVVVEFLLVFFVWKYRSRPGMPEPQQVHGNDRLELLWTVIPTVVLFGVLGYTIWTMVQLEQPAGQKLEVKAVGHQWWWEFQYPNQQIDTADTLVVPAGMTVQVDLVSTNVIHSFWVPALTGKTDVIPGHANTKWFEADQPGGPYRGECAEYCGTQHAHMNFEVMVLSKDGFNTWVSGQQQKAQTPTDALATKGAAVFKNACTVCHGIVGVNLDSFTATQTTDPLHTATNLLKGPNLTHFGSRHLIAGGVLSYDANSPECSPTNPNLLTQCNLAKWLKDPQAVKPGNDMVVQLSNDQIQQLVAYLESLK